MKLDQERVKRERESRAWSQEHVATATGLGLRTIQRIESTGVASADSTLALASVFELSVRELIPVAESPTKLSPGRRLGATVAIVCVLVAGLLAGRTALAQQTELAMGVSVDGTPLSEQTVIATQSHPTTVGFENQVKAIITSGAINIGSNTKQAISLEIYEMSLDGQYTLIGEPELVLFTGANWELEINGTPSGKSYRMTVKAQVPAS